MTEYKYDFMKHSWTGTNGVVISDEFYEYAMKEGLIVIGEIKTDKANGGFIKNIIDAKLVAQLSQSSDILSFVTQPDPKHEYYAKKKIGKLFNKESLNANLEPGTPNKKMSVGYIKSFFQELSPEKYKAMIKTMETQFLEWRNTVQNTLNTMRKSHSSADFIKRISLNEFIDVRIEIDINGQFVDQLTFYNLKTHEGFCYILMPDTHFDTAWNKNVVPVLMVWNGQDVKVEATLGYLGLPTIVVLTADLELRFDINPHKIKRENWEAMVRKFIINPKHVELAVFLADRKISKLQAAAKAADTESLSGLSNSLPGMMNKVVHPVTKEPGILKSTIINLNDSHKWSGDQIADWVESLDEVPVFEPVERVKNGYEELPEITFVGYTKRVFQGATKL